MNGSSCKWLVITDDSKQPLLVLDADAFCRAVMRESKQVDPLAFCKEPLTIREAGYTLGHALMDLKKAPAKVTKELVLVWNQTERRIISGSDVLGLLFKGV